MSPLAIIVLFVQTVAIIVMLMNGPQLLLSFIRSIRFESQSVIWYSTKNYFLLWAIMYLMINGLPKF